MHTVIGLEVHAQLNTKSKLFCGCSADYFQQEPNTHTCPVCLGMPGALPVLNQAAIEYTMRVGLALNCTIPPRSKFDRKNYFYPDLPKGYQISQFDEPVCKDGYLDIDVDGETHRVRINRVHLEEDAGKLLHAGGGISQVDLNRACVPLLEIVTEPDMRSPEQATAFMKSLRQLLRYLEVCDGDLEKGSLRCDANISVTEDLSTLGTKSEVKNMNSFKGVEDALRFEAARHIRTVDAGDVIVQETRGWDADKNVSVPQRAKEESDDYRYFPDPDLVPVLVSDEWRNRVREEMPETPTECRQRFKGNYDLPDYDIGVLTEEREVAVYFDQVAEKFNKPKEVSNWIMGEILRLLKDHDEIKVSAPDLADLLKLVDEDQINRNTGKEVIEAAFETGKSPLAIVEEKGLKQISDGGELEQLVQAVIDGNPDQVERYRGGKDGLIGWFVGQVMAQSGGKANPKTVKEIFESKLTQ
jgi:aspartyl-tRNA(Asn)/glutamyl-tRNA(Gln) amidotransferase subunit B